MKSSWWHLLSFSLCVVTLVTSTGARADDDPYPNVTHARLLGAQQDSGWLMYRRNYESSGYAPFEIINTKNVGKMKLAFVHATGLTQGHQSPPVVNGRYMFVTTPMNHLLALDAATGKLLWQYDHPLDPKALKTVCCDVVNRGVALYEDMVYMGTLGNHVVALDARTGAVKWSTELAPPGVGFFITSAPLVVNGKVIIGDGGGEYGARGFIVALDAMTGKLVWKTHTTAAPGTPGGDTWPEGAYEHGGGNPWITGSFDPSTNTLFWGVGNPAPWLATVRPGDNLYTNSVLALDPETGAIKWHYQWTPNDTWDYDGANEMVLTDITHHGKTYKGLVHADRNGWFYALDRTNGKFLYARPFANVTSIASIDERGVPRSDPSMRPSGDKQVFTCPSFIGAKNWWPIAISPQTRRAYIPTLHACMDIKANERPPEYKQGRYYVGESFELKPDPSADHWGSLQAVDLNSGKIVWQHKTHLPWTTGILTTAGGLVFGGRADGHLAAFHAETGELLWTSEQMRSGIVGVPTSYVVDGRQYVAIWAGWGGAVPMWGGQVASDPSIEKIPKGGHLYVFTL